MIIDVYASKPQYLTHILPIFLALPADQQGDIYIEQDAAAFAEWFPDLPLRQGRVPWDSDPVLMAGGTDLICSEGRPVIFVDHGAGQVYKRLDNVSYAGGLGRDAVRLFLCPNEQTAALNRATYRDVRAVAVGDATIRPRPPQGTAVAFTWHWNAPLGIPEAGCTWPYWRAAVEQYVADGHEVVGHAHPKMAFELQQWWEQLGVPYIPRFDDLIDQATVLVADNTSVIYEWAALDRPVVVLDHPSYRRDVTHGLRFWEAADVGVRIGAPEELADAIAVACTDPPEIAERRHAIISRVYTAIGNEATARAVQAIRDTFTPQ